MEDRYWLLRLSTGSSSLLAGERDKKPVFLWRDPSEADAQLGGEFVDDPRERGRKNAACLYRMPMIG